MLLKQERFDERLCLFSEPCPGIAFAYDSSPLPARYSAICTALVAAPFLRLSLTTHMFNVFSCVSSRRISGGGKGWPVSVIMVVMSAISFFSLLFIQKQSPEAKQ